MILQAEWKLKQIVGIFHVFIFRVICETSAGWLTGSYGGRL